MTVILKIRLNSDTFESGYAIIRNGIRTRHTHEEVMSMNLSAHRELDENGIPQWFVDPAAVRCDFCLRGHALS
jgi:hypothetical protein